jgi:hypothetical protein
MRGSCEEANIPLIDPTAALQSEVESGRNMYFPDDAHWNADGQELAAETVADFLKTRGHFTVTAAPLSKRIQTESSAPRTATNR